MGLVETGPHVVFAAALAPYATSEVTLAADALPALAPGMLCLADRFCPSFDLWPTAAATGAQLLWRIRRNARLPVLERFADGSYRSELRATWHSRATDRAAIPVRVVEYTLPKVRDADPVYRLVTTLLDPAAAPAAELAALYHERWEVEGTFDELKTHLKGAQVVLRSKTPVLVRQEAYGLLLAHYAVRGLLPEAAVSAPGRPRDPDTLSFVHGVRVLRRTLPRLAAVPPRDRPTLWQHLHAALLVELREERVSSSRGRSVPRGVKRKMTRYRVRPRRRRRNRPVVTVQRCSRMARGMRRPVRHERARAA